MPKCKAEKSNTKIKQKNSIPDWPDQRRYEVGIKEKELGMSLFMKGSLL
jgi:hypothetical protein